MSTTFGPYTPVRQAGKLWFVSGQVGVETSTGTTTPDVKTQTSQALANMRNVLAEQGLGMNDVVKTTLFVRNLDDFEAINAVYETFFETPRPARSTVEVAALPRVADNATLLVEIDAVAYKDA